MLSSTAARLASRSLRAPPVCGRTFSNAAKKSTNPQSTTTPVQIAGNLTSFSLAVTFVGLSVGSMLVSSSPEAKCEQQDTRGKVVALSLSSEATEPKTGIIFPSMVDGMDFIGAGVRVKYGFVKVYAVGVYSSAKSQPELLAANTDKSLRIVMNMNLSVDKYTAAIMEALTPRMNGQDMDKLEEFKSLNPPGELVQGTEMVMTIKGDTMHYRSTTGGGGKIVSQVFCNALCDTFLGASPVSPGLKSAVVAKLG